MSSLLTFFILLCISLFVTGHWLLFRSLQDPDRFFNLALAREISTRGVVHSLEQFPLLGWDRRFVDKEFFYHWILGFFYRWGGENGVEVFTLVLATGLPVGLFFILRNSLSKQWKGNGALWVAALGVGATYLLTSPLLIRSFSVRSFVFAQVLYLGLLLAWQTRKPVWVGIFSALFLLSYNNWLIILLTGGVFFLSGGFTASLRRVLALLAGVTLGVILNPYFPDHLELVWMGLDIASDRFSFLRFSHGLEVQSLGFEYTLYKFGFLILISLAGMALAYRDREIRPLAILGGVLSLLIFRNPRVSEYLVLVSILLLPSLLKNLRWLFGVFAVALVLQLPNQVFLWSESRPSKSENFNPCDLAEAIPKGAGLLHVNWGSGAFLFHCRPDLKLVDALDPIFLVLHSPELFSLRMKLINGAPGDWARSVTDKFHSTWVLTDSKVARSRLLQSPGFHLVKERVLSGPMLAEPVPLSLFQVTFEMPSAEDFSRESGAPGAHAVAALAQSIRR